MLEFKVIENLKPNKDLTNILKDFKYKINLGQIKTIFHTNLYVIIPTEYLLFYLINFSNELAFNIVLDINSPL